MSTIKLVAVWGMLVAVAVMSRQTAWDYAAGVAAIVAMLPLAIATRQPVAKRITVPANSRKPRMN